MVIAVFRLCCAVQAATMVSRATWATALLRSFRLLARIAQMCRSTAPNGLPGDATLQVRRSCRHRIRLVTAEVASVVGSEAVPRLCPLRSVAAALVASHTPVWRVSSVYSATLRVLVVIYTFHLCAVVIVTVRGGLRAGLAARLCLLIVLIEIGETMTRRSRLSTLPWRDLTPPSFAFGRTLGDAVRMLQ